MLMDRGVAGRQTWNGSIQEEVKVGEHLRIRLREKQELVAVRCEASWKVAGKTKELVMKKPSERVA